MPMSEEQLITELINRIKSGRAGLVAQEARARHLVETLKHAADALERPEEAGAELLNKIVAEWPSGQDLKTLVVETRDNRARLKKDEEDLEKFGVAVIRR